MKKFAGLLMFVMVFTSARAMPNSITKPIAEVSDNDWVFDKVSASTLLFKNGKSFNTHLYELKYIGQIYNGAKAPCLIFSGRDCDECDANISIYMHSPGDGKLIVGNGESSYQYPGTEKDIETNKIDYKARTFYGEVLNGVYGVIWYEKRILENNTWGNFIFLVKIENGLKKGIKIKNNEQINQTLALLKNGSCKEIKGRNYTSQP